MNKTPQSHGEHEALPGWLRGWERFWFTPADPSVLAMVRIACGVLVVYTLYVYSFNLPETMGRHAWVDLLLRLDTVRDAPVILARTETRPLPPPANEFEANYVAEYQMKWHSPPPPPYPTTLEQVMYLDQFRAIHEVDLRALGLRPPETEEEKKYVEDYMAGWKGNPLLSKAQRLPPPAYAKKAKEAEEIDDYRIREGVDPRLLYDRGSHAFSLWFHVTDDEAMFALHCVIVCVSILFTIGFCTRITSVLTWFGSLCYVHRNPTLLFGADTMMTILLMYLMIGPSGAVFSVDHFLGRWWRQAKPGIIRWWFALWRRPLANDAPIAPAFGGMPAEPEPSVSANLAIRLLQVHVAIIYLVAGLAKLKGASWWGGTAVWSTIADYEFAPMQYDFYLNFLRYLGTHHVLYSLVVTGGGLFTLFFEITYAFLIWHPRLRWLYLVAAIVLHGLIGVFMGLRTFALLMLIMNLAFLKSDEIKAAINWMTNREQR